MIFCVALLFVGMIALSVIVYIINEKVDRNSENIKSLKKLIMDLHPGEFIRMEDKDER